jgi:hypothetical protein
MKLSRRALLRGAPAVAAGAVAIAIAPSLPALPSPPVKPKRTVRYGLPVPQWRKLYGGVMPSKPIPPWRPKHENLVHNDILADLPWTTG